MEHSKYLRSDCFTIYSDDMQDAGASDVEASEISIPRTRCKRKRICRRQDATNSSQARRKRQRNLATSDGELCVRKHTACLNCHQKKIRCIHNRFGIADGEATRKPNKTKYDESSEEEKIRIAPSFAAKLTGFNSLRMPFSMDYGFVQGTQDEKQKYSLPTPRLLLHEARHQRKGHKGSTKIVCAEEIIETDGHDLFGMSPVRQRMQAIFDDTHSRNRVKNDTTEMDNNPTSSFYDSGLMLKLDTVPNQSLQHSILSWMDQGREKRICQRSKKETKGFERSLSNPNAGS